MIETGNHSLRFTDKLDVFLQWRFDPKQKFTEEQVSELSDELQRLTFLAELSGNQVASEMDGAQHTD